MNSDRCIKCGSCLRACPVLGDARGALFPGPRATGVDAPRFPERADAGPSALMCTMCHACELACPSSITLTKAMLRLRSELKGQGPSGHLRMRENVMATGRTVSADFDEWVEEGNDILYFPGCIGLGRLTSMTRAASSLLTSLDIKHDISSRALCCGSPLLKVGALEEAANVKRSNMEVLSAYRKVVVSCPGCAYQLRTEYGLEAKHMVEVLRDLPLRSRVEGRWALQMPCHLKRGLGPWTAEDLVGILERAGVELVRIPEEDVCCGGGGGLPSGFPELAASMARSKVRAYERAGVDGVITACPFCCLNLRREGLRVLDISEAVSLNE